MVYILFHIREIAVIRPEESSFNICDIIVTEDVRAARRSRGSSLEEGEVSDEAERRPEESEPRPVCRFFSRGACTWGVSCRYVEVKTRYYRLGLSTDRF